MNPLNTAKILNLRLSLNETKGLLLKERVKNAALEKRLQVQDKRVTHYMNINSDLWLQLSKLPGGLEQARRINALIS